MIEVVEFDPSHLDNVKQFDLLDCFQDDSLILERVLFNYQYVKADMGVAYTFMGREQEIFAIVGGVIQHAHSGTVWTLVLKSVTKYPKDYFANLGFLINSFAKRFKLKRLQTTVDYGNYEAYSQNIRFGFLPEGIMRMAGPTGKDQILMAKFFDEVLDGA